MVGRLWAYGRGTGAAYGYELIRGKLGLCEYKRSQGGSPIPRVNCDEITSGAYARSTGKPRQAPVVLGRKRCKLRGGFSKGRKTEKAAGVSVKFRNVHGEADVRDIMSGYE